jgi:hypothetical protein
MKQWHTQLGFSNYPLDPRSNPELVGVDDVEEHLKAYISQGNMCLLAGFTGSGKTSMLKKIAMDPDFADFKFIYISADGVKKDFDVSDAIEEHKTFWDRLRFTKPRNLVILLDECHMATRNLTESIKSKWNFLYPDGTKCIQSVVVCQISDKLSTNFSGSFADRLGGRILRMPRLTKTQLAEVLNLRLQSKDRTYADAFNKDAIDLLVTSADGSVRQLLEYTDAVFRTHASFGEENPLLQWDYKISKEVVFNALQTSGLQPKEKRSSKMTYLLKKIKKSKRYSKAVEMFEQFGTLSSVQLAEKLDTTKKNADSILRQLKKWDAIVISHEDADHAYHVLSPRLQHELTKA